MKFDTFVGWGAGSIRRARDELERIPASESLRVLRDGMLSVVPAFITAALFLASASLIRLSFGPSTIVDALTDVHDTISALVPYMMTASIGFTFAVRRSIPRFPTALMCVVFLRIVVSIVDLGSGAPSVTVAPLLAMIMPLGFVPLVAHLHARPWSRLSRRTVVEDNIIDAMNLVIPAFAAALVAFGLGWLVRWSSFPSWSLRLLSTIGTHDAYLTGVIVCVLNSLLWLVGIHGYHAIRPAFESLDAGVALNAVSVAAGDGASHVVNGSFMGCFVFIGGSGGTASLALAILLFSKNNVLRMLAWASVPLALLNVNETLLFGIPIVFSIRLGIPFLLVPLLNLAIAAVLTRFGVLAPTIAEVPLNTPMFVNAFIATDGNWLAPFIQIGMVGLSALVYAPFVRRFERTSSPENTYSLSAFDFPFVSLIDRATASVKDPLIEAHQLVKANRRQRQAVERIAGYEFFVQYQPQVSLDTGQCVGAEALLRARDESGKTVYPPSFMPWLQSDGLRFEMDRWVAQRAAVQCQKWQLEGHPQHISINLAPSTLSDEVAAAEVANVLADARGQIAIEITEDSLIGDAAVARKVLKAFRDAGCEIHIDDFGSGYSSLSYLFEFDVDVLKVDRSFVIASADPRGRAVLGGVMSFAEALDMDVVVEGVETAEQMELIRDLSTNRLDRVSIQGWYYSKALDPDDFLSFALDRSAGTLCIP